MSTDDWLEVSLDEVCSLITDGTHHSPPNGPTGTYRYVTAKNIRPWGLDLDDITWVTPEVHREIYARCPVEYEDVLYIKDGVTTGLAVLNHLREPFSMLSSVALLKPRREVVRPSYLKHWLNSPTTFARMTADMTGSAIRRLVLRQIRGATISVPPLPEQKRIADKLDTLLARVDACRERLDRIPAILKRFRQSVLAAATSGKLTEEWRESRDAQSDTKQLDVVNEGDLPKRWLWSCTEEIKTSDRYSLAIGPFGSNLKVSDYRAEGTPLVFVKEIRNKSFGGPNTKYVSKQKAEELAAHSYRSRGSINHQNG